MGNFASGVAALPRIVTLHDIEITPAGGKDLSAGDLVLNVTAKTYRYLDEDEQAPADADKGAKKAGKKKAGKSDKPKKGEGG
jgi:type IV pilus assembly protein PilO